MKILNSDTDPFYVLQADSYADRKIEQFRVISADREIGRLFVKSNRDNRPLYVDLNSIVPLCDGDPVDQLIPGETFVMLSKHKYWEHFSDEDMIEVVRPLVFEICYGDIQPDPEIPSSFPEP